jgi:hypothetical protein
MQQQSPVVGLAAIEAGEVICGYIPKKMPMTGDPYRIRCLAAPE